MTESETQPEPTPPPRPPRNPTFLARYPRYFKITVTVLLLFASIVPSYLSSSNAAKHKAAETHETSTAKSEDVEAPQFEEIDESKIVNNAPVADEETAIAMKENDTDDHNAMMTSAPDKELIQISGTLAIPQKSKDGRLPRIVYARPFNRLDQRPRIAIIVADMGLSNTSTAKAVERLPSNVTFAFDVQSANVREWSDRARQDGHETILSLPMEPLDYPQSDPGANTQLLSLPDADNNQRLMTALGQASGYVGVTTFSGSRFINDKDKMELFLKDIDDRGLMVFDAQIVAHSQMTDVAKSKKIPLATASRRIDSDPSPESIDLALRQLELQAYQSGKAIGIMKPYPASIDRVAIWAAKLPRHGIALAPLSAMVSQ